eukprot:2322661-Ditylum_brightwellii.AAC.1
MDRDLGNFLSNTGLYNIMTIRHGLDSPKTYINVNATLDYMVRTINLVPPFRKGSWLVYHYMIFADHRGVALDVNTRNLFRGEIHAIRENNRKQISTKHYKQSTMHCKEVSEKTRENKVQEKTKQLTE